MADSNENNKPAKSKREKISKTQKTILMVVLGTSLVFGLCLVLAIHFIKYISFNMKVIEKKDQAIEGYEQTIKNIGVCSSPKGKKYTVAELKQCNPNNLSNATMAETLRYNVTEEMSRNDDLESMARTSQKDCFDKKGTKIDFRAKYDETEDEDERAYYLSMVKMCSALRTIPDALPSKKNVEAMLASLNQIFIISNWDPEALSPDDEEVESIYEGVGTIPLSLAVESNSDKTMAVLKNIERSIRNIDFTSASVEWLSADKLSLQGKALAYYLEGAGVKETDETVYASKEKAKEARINSGSEK